MYRVEIKFLTGNEHLLFRKFRKLVLFNGNTQAEVNLKLLADGIQLGQRVCQILALQMGDLLKAVQIHLLQVVIL